MKIVIIGAGAVGSLLAQQLAKEKHDVVLIERNADVVRQATSALDCMVIHGEGTRESVLRQAGTGDADFFIAAADADEVNMIACGIVSSDFEKPAKIARVRSFDYNTARLAEKRFLGIDFVVNPEIEAAHAILRAVESGAVSDIIAFEQSRVQIRSIVVDRGGILEQTVLKDLPDILKRPALVAVVIRGNRYLIPSGETKLLAGDILYVVAREEHFDEIFRALGKPRRVLKRVVVVGGGKIGTQVAERLLAGPRKSVFRRMTDYVIPQIARNVKIVERDYSRCKELSERFPNALVINSDISAEGVFEEQHLSDSDLVIAATDNQELNIVTSLFAKSLGVDRAIALVNKTGYAPIAAQLGVDVTVSQKNAIVSSILRFIRSGVVKSVHTISDGEIEATELTVRENSRAVGIAIKNLSLPNDSLVVSLERENAGIVPGGNNVIRGNDHLILISKKEDASRIQQVFKG